MERKLRTYAPLAHLRNKTDGSPVLNIPRHPEGWRYRSVSEIRAPSRIRLPKLHQREELRPVGIEWKFMSAVAYPDVIEDFRLSIVDDNYRLTRRVQLVLGMHE